MHEIVTPAKAGVQKANPLQYWIPALSAWRKFQPSSGRNN